MIISAVSTHLSEWILMSKQNPAPKAVHSWTATQLLWKRRCFCATGGECEINPSCFTSGKAKQQTNKQKTNYYFKKELFNFSDFTLTDWLRHLI